MSEGRRDSRVYQALVAAVLVLGAVPVVLPLFWLATGSLKSRERISHYPPDWLPVDVRDSVLVNGGAVDVVVVDEGQWSGVARVKFAAGAAVEIDEAALARGETREHFIVRDGRRQRVQPVDEARADSPADRPIEVRLPGRPAVRTIPIASLRAQRRERWYYSILGREIEVALAAPLSPDAKTAQIAPLEFPTLSVGRDKLEPAVTDEADRWFVRWRDNRCEVERVAENSAAQYWEVRLRPVGDANSWTAPVHELRRETTPIALWRDGEAEREVRVLERDEPGGVATVEVLDEPATLRVSAADVQTETRIELRANVLGQDVPVEIVESIGRETSAPSGRGRPSSESQPEHSKPIGRVAVRPLTPLDVAIGLIRHEAPLRPRWSNYRAAWQEQTFDRYVVNTLFVAALIVLGTVLSCGLVGYAFARLEFRGRDVLFLLLLSTMMIPGQVTSIPTFVMFVKFGWIDTYRPLIVPAFLAGSAFFVFLYRQYMLSIPTDMEDSARIDGCGPLATWWLIILPLCRPIIVTVAVFSFLGVWNDFLGPLLYINSDEKLTVAVGLQNFMSAFGGAEPQLIMAASSMMMLPTIVLFFFAQKAFIRGVVVSGVKG